jgi:hypothetical protein
VVNYLLRELVGHVLLKKRFDSLFIEGDLFMEDQNEAKKELEELTGDDTVLGEEIKEVVGNNVSSPKGDEKKRPFAIIFSDENNSNSKWRSFLQSLVKMFLLGIIVILTVCVIWLLVERSSNCGEGQHKKVAADEMYIIERCQTFLDKNNKDAAVKTVIYTRNNIDGWRFLFYAVLKKSIFTSLNDSKPEDFFEFKEEWISSLEFRGIQKREGIKYSVYKIPRSFPFNSRGFSKFSIGPEPAVFLNGQEEK